MKNIKNKTWVDLGDGKGYWTTIRNDSHRHKLDFFCKHCKRITGEIDNKYLLEYGICAECYILFVEDREIPLIDLSLYKK